MRKKKIKIKKEKILICRECGQKPNETHYCNEWDEDIKKNLQQNN